MCGSFRQVPPFGRDTIWCFHKNVSKLKKLAARDFKDILQVGFASSLHCLLTHCLQCSIPVSAGLLQDPHNNQIMQLLFLLCHWHGLAKLCMHTDNTLNLLENMTTDLANHLCRFVSDTCLCFATKELRRKADACKRRQECKNPGAGANCSQTASSSARWLKGLNLQKYKLHVLADYPAHIWVFSTTDSYSMQPVSASQH